MHERSGCFEIAERGPEDDACFRAVDGTGPRLGRREGARGYDGAKSCRTVETTDARGVELRNEVERKGTRSRGSGVGEGSIDPRGRVLGIR
jgi:hypothetical protein